MYVFIREYTFDMFLSDDIHIYIYIYILVYTHTVVSRSGIWSCVESLRVSFPPIDMNMYTCRDVYLNMCMNIYVHM